MFSGARDAARGFRGSEYVATFKFKWNNSTSPGWLVRWLDPGNFLAVVVLQTDSKARLYQCEGDGGLSTLATSGTALNLTTDNWYEAKVVIDTDAGSQRLRFWVDTDADGDYSDETTLLSTNTVDDDWDAGYVGLYRREPGSNTQQFDDVKIGLDNNSDGDILDAGDDVQIDDDFGSNAMSLTYDNNGNLTDDGIFKFVYDAWNRLRKVTRRVDAQTTIAEYEYDGTNRRTQKVVSNCGPEAVANDGGNTTVHYYYSHQWQILETRDGSNQTTRQWVWGLGGVGVSPAYIDELILMDVNGDPTIGNDTNPDNTATGEGDENPPDKRYFYHQDRNWNVIALSEYVPSGGSGVNGRIVERYTYTPYGEFVVLKGDSGSGELGSAALTSPAGNIFFHQGLPLDQEKQGYQNRDREFFGAGVRFPQRDPAGVSDGPNPYLYLSASPTSAVDPSGSIIQVTPPAVCPAVASALNGALGPQTPPPVSCQGNGQLDFNGICPTWPGTTRLCWLLDQAWFYNITFAIVSGNNNVWFDTFATDAVDIADLTDATIPRPVPPSGSPSLFTTGQWWAHIISERICKAQGGTFPVCHLGAVYNENEHRRDLGQALMTHRAWGAQEMNCPGGTGANSGVETYANGAVTCWQIGNGPVIYHSETHYSVTSRPAPIQPTAHNPQRVPP